MRSVFIADGGTNTTVGTIREIWWFGWRHSMMKVSRNTICTEILVCWYISVCRDGSTLIRFPDLLGKYIHGIRGTRLGLPRRLCRITLEKYDRKDEKYIYVHIWTSEGEIQITNDGLVLDSRPSSTHLLLSPLLLLLLFLLLLFLLLFSYSYFFYFSSSSYFFFFFFSPFSVEVAVDRQKVKALAPAGRQTGRGPSMKYIYIW